MSLCHSAQANAALRISDRKRFASSKEEKESSSLEEFREERSDDRIKDASIVVRDPKSIARQLSVPIILNSQVDSRVDRCVEKRPLINGSGYISAGREAEPADLQDRTALNQSRAQA